MDVHTSKGIKSALEQIDEAWVYKSNETELLWSSLHFLQFNCDFDLFYIPFDQQTCYAEICVGINLLFCNLPLTVWAQLGKG